MDMASFPQSHEPTSASLTFLSAFTELKRTSALPGLGFGLRECCGWFDLPSRPLNFLPISNKAASLTYHSYVHSSSNFNFLQKLFLCMHNLANCLVKEAQLLACLGIWNALLTELNDCQLLPYSEGGALLLSPPHLDATVGLWTGLNPIALDIKEQEGWRRGREIREPLVCGAVSTYTLSMKFTVLDGCCSWCHKQS